MSPRGPACKHTHRDTTYRENMHTALCSVTSESTWTKSQTFHLGHRGKLSMCKEQIHSLTTKVPCHQDFTHCPEGLTLPSSPLQKRQALFSTLFPMQFRGACLPDTHPPPCTQQQWPNSTAARMKGHGGNGWRGGFSDLHHFCDAV